MGKKIKRSTLGDREFLKFISKQNQEGTLSFDDTGFSFKGQVGQLELIEYASSVNTINAKDGNLFKITMNANITGFTIENAKVGIYTLVFEQDSTGGRTITFGSDFYAESAVGAPDWGTASANQINMISVFYDGSKFYISPMTDFTSI